MEPELPRAPMDFLNRPGFAKMVYPQLKRVPGSKPLHVSYPHCASAGKAPATKLPMGSTPVIRSRPQRFFPTTT